jgi:hypothetical protein
MIGRLICFVTIIIGYIISYYSVFIATVIMLIGLSFGATLILCNYLLKGGSEDVCSKHKR